MGTVVAVLDLFDLFRWYGASFDIRAVSIQAFGHGVQGLLGELLAFQVVLLGDSLEVLFHGHENARPLHLLGDVLDARFQGGEQLRREIAEGLPGIGYGLAGGLVTFLQVIDVLLVQIVGAQVAAELLVDHLPDLSGEAGILLDIRHQFARLSEGGIHLELVHGVEYAINEADQLRDVSQSVVVGAV